MRLENNRPPQKPRLLHKILKKRPKRIKEDAAAGMKVQKKEKVKQTFFSFFTYEASFIFNFLLLKRIAGKTVSNCHP
jgi:hypothetical protein